MKISKSFITKTITMSALCATMATASFAAPAGTFDTPEIHVSATASRSVTPTYAILTLGITSENTNINTAKSNNDNIMSNLISKLSGLGIAKNDIYTSNISINTTSDYQEGKRVNTGYRIHNNVTIKINDLSSVSKAIDAAVSIGANDINNLSYQNDPSQQLTDALTTEAVKNGRHKAEIIAAALGRTLGPVKSVSITPAQTTPINGYQYRAVKYADSAALGTTTPTEQGSLIVSQDADMTFYLQ